MCKLEGVVPPGMESFVVQFQTSRRDVSVGLGASICMSVLNTFAFTLDDTRAAFPNLERSFSKEVAQYLRTRTHSAVSSNVERPRRVNRRGIS